MTGSRRLIRRLTTAYRHRCAREDARRMRLAEIVGVWQCEHCDHVSLSSRHWYEHRTVAHA